MVYLRHPITVLAPTLFPFFRHTIANVRLAVVKTLYTFMTVPTLSKDWMTLPFLRLLYQNLVVEERNDIREATLSAWRLVLSTLSSVAGWMEALISQPVLLEWYAVLMTPLGLPLDASNFYDPTVSSDHERHNVDKNMLAQDLALISVEIVLKARIAAASALAYVIAFWPRTVSSRRCKDVQKRTLLITISWYRVCNSTICSVRSCFITLTPPVCFRSS